MDGQGHRRQRKDESGRLPSRSQIHERPLLSTRASKLRFVTRFGPVLIFEVIVDARDIVAYTTFVAETSRPSGNEPASNDAAC
jgi:hypothetical protein